MRIKRHREEFSLCDWQFLLEFDKAVFHAKGESQHFFVHFGFRRFCFFGQLNALVMGVKWQVTSGKDRDWLRGQGGQGGEFWFAGVDRLKFAPEL